MKITAGMTTTAGSGGGGDGFGGDPIKGIGVKTKRSTYSMEARLGRLKHSMRYPELAVPFTCFRIAYYAYKLKN